MAAVAAIEQVAFSDPWSERDFRECVESGVPFLVAEMRDTVVGYAIAQYAADEGEILNLGVAPDRRRRGIGHDLVEAMLARLREEGVRNVFLEVRESNASAQRVYAALGFAEVGRRNAYYRYPREDAVILRTRIDRAKPSA